MYGCAFSCKDSNYHQLCDDLSKYICQLQLSIDLGGDGFPTGQIKFPKLLIPTLGKAVPLLGVHDLRMRMSFQYFNTESDLHQRRSVEASGLVLLGLVVTIGIVVEHCRALRYTPHKHRKSVAKTLVMTPFCSANERCEGTVL